MISKNIPHMDTATETIDSNLTQLVEKIKGFKIEETQVKVNDFLRPEERQYIEILNQCPICVVGTLKEDVSIGFGVPKSCTSCKASFTVYERTKQVGKLQTISARRDS
jgi:hypothetical protein